MSYFLLNLLGICTVISNQWIIQTFGHFLKSDRKQTIKYSKEKPLMSSVIRMKCLFFYKLRSSLPPFSYYQSSREFFIIFSLYAKSVYIFVNSSLRYLNEIYLLYQHQVIIPVLSECLPVLIQSTATPHLMTTQT